MNDLIVKLFGVNRMNLFGWCAAGLIAIVVAVFLVVEAAIATRNFDGRPDLMLLAAIAVLLLGIFGVLLQIYCAMLAEKLERKQAERRSRDNDD